MSRVFLNKRTKKKKKTIKIKKDTLIDFNRLSLKTQYKIEFLLPFTSCRKVLV